jgi:DNA-binding NtrC family response regulator
MERPMSEILPGRILIVDDEAPVSQAFGRILECEGHEVEAVDSAAAACERLEAQSFDVAFIDLRLGQSNGLAVLQHIQDKRLDTVGIVITGYATLDSALQAIRAKAFDYILKPCQGGEILDLARRAIEWKRQRGETPLVATSHPSRRLSKAKKIVGKSPKMRELNELVERVARSSSTALIRGESGTGKELVARALHDLSPRSQGPMVPVNCGAIPEELLESELFGHVRGSFTGAVADRMGRFVLADKGTIFLDEIGDMSPKLQVKVLRVLQEQELEPVGSIETLRVNTRVVAATNVDLERAVEEKRFREDLYYRLNVVPIEVPALRERTGDIPLLIKHFLKIFNQRQERQLEGFSSEALGILENFDWPGNVRELENLVERMTILARGTLVTPDDLPAKFRLRRDNWVSMAVAETKSADQAPIRKAGMGIPACAVGVKSLDSISHMGHPPKMGPTEGLSLEEQSLIRVWGADSARVGDPGAADLDATVKSFTGESQAPVTRFEPPESGMDLTGLVDDFERGMILRALEKCDGVKSRAAEMLGIKRTTLVEKMKKKSILFEK